jgi:hypothetical protein
VWNLAKKMSEGIMRIPPPMPNNPDNTPATTPIARNTRSMGHQLQRRREGSRDLMYTEPYPTADRPPRLVDPMI